jgi:soluble lytic murein transglycosylase
MGKPIQLSLRAASGTALALSLVLLATGAQAQANARAQSDPTVQALEEAHRAWRSKNTERLQVAATTLRGQPAAAYPEYWQAMLAPHDAVIRRFLERHPQSVLAERMRQDWVRGIAKRQDWALVLQAAQGIESMPLDVACWQLRARHAQGNDGAGDVLLRQHWPRMHGLPEGCVEVARALAGRGRLPAQSIWQRARMLVGVGELGAARQTLALMPAPPALTAAQTKLLFAAPPAALRQHQPTSAFERELLAMAWARVAVGNTHTAADWLQQQPKRLDTVQRAYVQAQLGLHGAMRHEPGAANWFALAATAPGPHLSDEHRAWWVRAALRQQRWGDVRNAIAGMSVAARQESRWQYWLGRAEQALGDASRAREAWRMASREHGFYGRLAQEAQEALQQAPPASPTEARPRTAVDLVEAAWQLEPITWHDSQPTGIAPASVSMPTRPSAAAVQAVAKQPGIALAVALHRAGLHSQAAAEWQWAIRRFSDAELTAAALHAQALGLYGRMLDAMERVDGPSDLRLRYPTPAPFGHAVRSAAQQSSIDPALVFAVMHQESRFSPAASSSVGARGLMQVMPSTGRWLAEQQGWRGFDPAWLDEPPRNITLGTSYLRRLRTDLGHTVLAVAGYNAGPGRALAWRAERSVEGAVYAESIPFPETRDYVKRVMTAWLHYGEMLGTAPRRLTQKLGVVPAGAKTAQPSGAAPLASPPSVKAKPRPHRAASKPTAKATAKATKANKR